MLSLYAISDAKWIKIKDLLPGREGTVGTTAKNNRLFIDAILYRYRTGMPWRALPKEFGDFRVVHLRFSRWSKKGIWKQIFSQLIDDADYEYEMIDSTVVRAHQHSAGALKTLQENGLPNNQAIGRSVGGLSTKIHAMVDALGNPTRFCLTPGQAHDLQGADVLLPEMVGDTLLADKAYDADDRVRNPLIKKGKTLVIPPKKTVKNPPPTIKNSTKPVI